VSTRETIELTQNAADRGYSIAMVVTPYYYTSRITSDVMYEHFLKVAQNSPIPILLYNVPPFSAVTIPVDLISRLSSVKNIVGVKDTTGSIAHISETVRNTPPGFAVLAGSGGYFLQSLVSGAKGGVMALSNILPDDCCTLYNYFLNGKFAEAIALQKRLVNVNDIATAKFGVGGLKAALDILGYYGGKPREPLPVPSNDQLAQIINVLSQYAKQQ